MTRFPRRLPQLPHGRRLGLKEHPLPLPVDSITFYAIRMRGRMFIRNDAQAGLLQEEVLVSVRHSVNMLSTTCRAMISRLQLLTRN